MCLLECIKWLTFEVRKANTTALLAKNCNSPLYEDYVKRAEALMMALNIVEKEYKA